MRPSDCSKPQELWNYHVNNTHRSIQERPSVIKFLFSYLRKTTIASLTFCHRKSRALDYIQTERWDKHMLLVSLITSSPRSQLSYMLLFVTGILGIDMTHWFLCSLLYVTLFVLQPAAMFKVLHKDPPIPENLSHEGKEFLQCCFKRIPAERPTASELLDHPFIRNSSHYNKHGSIHSFAGIKVNVSLFFWHDQWGLKDTWEWHTYDATDVLQDTTYSSRDNRPTSKSDSNMKGKNTNVWVVSIKLSLCCLG